MHCGFLRRGVVTGVLLGLLLLAGCATLPGERVSDRFEQGKQAYLSGQYSRAFELLLREAEDGNPEAQYTVGYMYYEGQGVNQDDQAALRWIRESAAGGHSKAVDALGQMAGMGARQRARPPADEEAQTGTIPPLDPTLQDEDDPALRDLDRWRQND